MSRSSRARIHHRFALHSPAEHSPRTAARTQLISATKMRHVWSDTPCLSPLSNGPVPKKVLRRALAEPSCTACRCLLAGATTSPTRRPSPPRSSRRRWWRISRRRCAQVNARKPPLPLIGRRQNPLIEPSASSPFTGLAGRAAARAHPAPAQTDGTADCPPQEPPAAGQQAAHACFARRVPLGSSRLEDCAPASISARCVFPCICSTTSRLARGIALLHAGEHTCR